MTEKSFEIKVIKRHRLLPRSNFARWPVKNVKYLSTPNTPITVLVWHLHVESLVIDSLCRSRHDWLIDWLEKWNFENFKCTLSDWCLLTIKAKQRNKRKDIFSRWNSPWRELDDANNRTRNDSSSDDDDYSENPAIREPTSVTWWYNNCVKWKNTIIPGRTTSRQ